MSRTRKQPYRKSRAFDSSCRCHGSCGWCQGNRLHAVARRLLSCLEQVREWQRAVTLGKYLP
jgi:hypothetical protein